MDNFSRGPPLPYLLQNTIYAFTPNIQHRYRLEDSYGHAHAETHILSIHQNSELLRGQVPTHFPIWEASWATLGHQPFYQLSCFLSGLISVFTTNKGTIKGLWQSYCQSQHKSYLSSSPAFWSTSNIYFLLMLYVSCSALSQSLDFLHIQGMTTRPLKG